jgi:drug/metabolite transporter (DMT)-like permease
MAIATGIFLASRSRDEPPAAAEVIAGPVVNRTDPRAIVFALAGAAMFGVNLYATGWLGSEVPLGWVVLPARVVGVLILALPLAAMRRLPLTRRAAALVTVTGICEVAGTAALAAAARDGIAVASVLASQFGAIAAVVALVLFRERLARVQIMGVVTIACGVALLAALRT